MVGDVAAYISSVLVVFMLHCSGAYSWIARMVSSLKMVCLHRNMSDLF